MNDFQIGSLVRFEEKKRMVKVALDPSLIITVILTIFRTGSTV